MTSADDSHRPGSCPACGASVQGAWRHCGACGAGLVDDGPAEHRHHVTVVVSDLQGSTALAEALDPESLRLVLDRYFDELGAVLAAHGGRIEKRIGDMMVTVFGLPEPRPDDAIRALRAVAEAQQTLARLNEQLATTWGVRLVNRTGVDTGPVVYAAAGSAHRVLAGEAFEVASALEPLAPPLEVLVSGRTAHDVDGLATFGPAQSLTARGGGVLTAHRMQAVTTSDDDAEPTAEGACDGCGAISRPDDGWCTSCGLPLLRRARQQDRRRTVTIVFADLRLEHTGIGVDPPVERAALIRTFEATREVLEQHGGIVENFIGDAVMAIYGLDRRHEDDAERAARAAIEVQDRLAVLADDIEKADGVRVVARIGVNTGPVIAGDPDAGERLVTGDAVNVAARLEQAAGPGEVVIGEATRRLLGAVASAVRLEPLALKGKAEAVSAHRLLAVGAHAAASSRFELPLVGRGAEVSALHRAWDATASGRSWRRLDVRGEAGVGKSRLVYELLDRIGVDGRVLRGACLPYGEGITFWPIAEVIRQAAGVTPGLDVEQARRAVAEVAPDAEVAGRLWVLLGLDDRIVAVPELSWAVRRLLDHLATDGPLVVVIDGLHWAEATLLELLDDLIALGGSVPALLITMSRTAHGDDGDDDHIDDGIDDRIDAVLRVEPLDEAECDRLITHALGEAALPASLRAHIVRAASGVPLFVEQLLTMLIDDGRLVRGPSGWQATASIDDLAVPPTVEAILAARIDALPDAERRTLEPASVIGREFNRAAAERLSHSADLREPLESLRRRQLVAASRNPDTLVDHRFRNLLIRDVVYDSLLKRLRSGLHRDFGDWLLDGPARGRIAEFEEIVGYHLERAYLLGAEIAAPDEALVEVGRRASHHLGAAGRRAFARGDMPAAANLLERAARTLHDDSGEAARLMVLAGDAAFEEGAFDVSLDHYDEAGRMAAAAGDEVTVAQARLARATQGYLTGDWVDAEAARAAADDAEAVFTSHGAEAGVARCWRLRAYVELTHCQWGAAERAATATIEAARRAGDHVLERRVQPALAAFCTHGPTPVPDALARCDDLLLAVDGDRRARALIERSKSFLLALRGDFDEARTLCASTRASLLELGWNFDAALVSIDLGPIELMSGRPDAAERELRADFETLRAMGEQNYLSTTTYLLAEAVRRQGRNDEALSLAEEAAAIAAEDDIFSQAGWRAVRLRVLAEGGEPDAALDLAQEVLAMVLGTDDPSAHGDAYLDLSDLRGRLGDSAGARHAALEAAARFTAKGNRVGLAHARALLGELS